MPQNIGICRSHLGHPSAQDGTIRLSWKNNSLLQDVHGTLEICSRNVCQWSVKRMDEV